MVDEVCQSVSLSFACRLIVARLVLDTQRSAGFGFAWCFGTPGRLGLRCSWNFGVCFAVFCFVFFFLFPLSVSSTQFSGQKTFDYRPATTNSSLNTAPSLIHPTALEVCGKIKVIFQPAGFMPFH